MLSKFCILTLLIIDTFRGEVSLLLKVAGCLRRNGAARTAGASRLLSESALPADAVDKTMSGNEAVTRIVISERTTIKGTEKSVCIRMDFSEGHHVQQSRF